MNGSDGSAPTNGPRISAFRCESERFVVFSAPAAAAPCELSAAERSVATLAARGLSNQEIAARRATTARTVANQLQSIYRKLGLTGRRQLVATLR